MSRGTHECASRRIPFEDFIVLGFLSAMALWTYVGVPAVYSWNDPTNQSATITMQATNWLTLLITFLGGSMASFGVKALIDRRNRPIIRARVVNGRGCYVTTGRGNPPTHQARFLRLIIENDGYSSIKDCKGYITAIRRIVNGSPMTVQQEVLELCWSVGDGARPRNIPRGAFFYLDVASLDLVPGGGQLGLSVAWWPNHFANLLAIAATFELEIKIAADNAAPVDRIVRFDFNPQHQDLIFTFD
jgi:hypothetical protein